MSSRLSSLPQSILNALSQSSTNAPVATEMMMKQLAGLNLLVDSDPAKFLPLIQAGNLGAIQAELNALFSDRNMSGSIDDFVQQVNQENADQEAAMEVLIARLDKTLRETADKHFAASSDRDAQKEGVILKTDSMLKALVDANVIYADDRLLKPLVTVQQPNPEAPSNARIVKAKSGVQAKVQFDLVQTEPAEPAQIHVHEIEMFKPTQDGSLERVEAPEASEAANSATSMVGLETDEQRQFVNDALDHLAAVYTQTLLERPEMRLAQQIALGEGVAFSALISNMMTQRLASPSLPQPSPSVTEKTIPFAQTGPAQTIEAGSGG